MKIKLNCKYNSQKDEYIINIPKIMITNFKFPSKYLHNEARSFIKQILYISLAVIMTIALAAYKFNIILGIEDLMIIWVVFIIILTIITKN